MELLAEPCWGRGGPWPPKIFQKKEKEDIYISIIIIPANLIFYKNAKELAIPFLDFIFINFITKIHKKNKNRHNISTTNLQQP